MGENGNKILMALLLGVFIVTTLQFVSHFLYHDSEFETIGEVDGTITPPPPEQPVPICPLLASADISIGETIVKANCTSCHQLNNEVHGQGPHLVGLIGRDVASTDFGGYSSGLRALGGQWDEENLNAFLHNPQQYVPGTAMNFAGWENAKTPLRVNVIAYLYSLSGAEFPECPTLEEAQELFDAASNDQ